MKSFFTAGQEDYDRLRPLSYPQTDVFLLCYAVNNRASFLNTKDKWSSEVQYYCPGIPLVLVATKVDLKNTDQHETVSYDEGMQMARDIGKYNIIPDAFATNIKYYNFLHTKNTLYTDCFYFLLCTHGT